MRKNNLLQSRHETFTLLGMWVCAAIVATMEFMLAVQVGQAANLTSMNELTFVVPLSIGALIGIGEWIIVFNQQRLTLKVEQDLQHRTLQTSLEVTSSEKRVEILNFLNNDSHNGAPLFPEYGNSLIVGLFSFFAACAYSFSISTSLTIWIVALCLLGLIAPYFTTKGLSGLQTKQQVSSGKVQSTLIQLMRGKLVLNVFEGQDYALHSFDQSFSSYLQARLKTGIRRVIVTSIGIGMGFLFDISILALEIWFVGHHQISISQYAAIALFTPSFTWLFYSLPAIYSAIIRSQASVKRLTTFMQLSNATVPEATTDLTTLDPSATKGTIEIKDLSFRYPNTDSDVLHHLSFKVNVPTDKLLITGPSGTGKSTLFNVILGEIVPTSGHVLWNSRTFLSSKRHKLMALVPQVNGIFNDTLLNNIVLNRQFFPEEIDEIIEEVGLRDFIESLPNGLHTKIGSAEQRLLSAGQIQKVGIARSLLAKRPLLMLDEPFANLDEASAKALSAILGDLEASEIIISHRLEIPMTITKHFVLNNGTLQSVLAETHESQKDTLNNT